MVVATRQTFAERVGEFCNAENGKRYLDLDCVVCEECCSVAAFPWLIIPALFVVVAVLAFSFVGDGLRDAADPLTRVTPRSDGAERRRPACVATSLDSRSIIGRVSAPP